MLEPVISKRGRSARSVGKPPTRPSETLRTLAWIRYLLRNFEQVRSQCEGRSGEPRSWKKHQPDVEALRQAFRVYDIKTRLSEPTPTSLDATLGTAIGLPNWFARKLAQLQTHPSAGPLKRINNLVPGSQRAFDEPPKGFDPWFYHALDFQNPWVAELFLLRVRDPEMEEEGWDEFVDTEKSRRTRYPRWRQDDLESLPYAWDLSKKDQKHFSRKIVPSLTMLAYGLEPGHFEVESYRKDLRRAFARQQPDAHLPGLASGIAISTWVNAMAIYRLCQLAKLKELDLAAWCYWHAVEGIRARFATRQNAWFYPAPRGAGALELELGRLGLWR